MPDPRDSRRVANLRARDAKPAVDGEAPDIEVAALRYDADGGDHAPKLIARGRGHAAARILELAEQHSRGRTTSTRAPQPIAAVRPDRQALTRAASERRTTCVLG
jgi:hypothetical protein